MPDTAELTDSASMIDTEARLLALEMVTVAALNRLAGAMPELASAMAELGEPSALPSRPAAGDRAFLEHVRDNVSRLAAGITGKL